MTLRRIGLSFAKAFVASFLVLTPGIIAAPNLTAAKAALAAAIIGAIDAGLKAGQIALEKKEA